MKTIKLIARYIIITYILYLTYMVTSVEYINALGEGKAGILQVSTGAVFGALTLILNFHFREGIDG